LSTIDARTQPWNVLVQKTQACSRFADEYKFERDGSWVEAKKYGDWCTKRNLPTVLAIDCEMCQTEDPVTKVKDHGCLIRFSVVNGFNPSEVLIDKLVSPALPISDARTSIHGITEDQLRGVQYTLRQAQADLLNMCSDRTVLIGHSLHKDLKALRFCHTNVIDTAYLYSVENEPGSSPSMRDVSEFVLGVKLPDIHDSIQDARTSLQAALYVLVYGEPPAVPRMSKGGVSTKSTLLVHRIPDHCTDSHINQMIIGYTQIVPTSVSVINRGGGEAIADGSPQGANSSSSSSAPKGKATITFSTPMHAELAFASIPGVSKPDKTGKGQKKVFFKPSAEGGAKTGDHIYVREG